MIIKTPLYLESYFEDLGKLLSISKVQVEVLTYLVREFYAEDIRMTNNKILKLCKLTKVTYPSLRNILSKLVKKGVLVRKDLTIYSLNPLYDPMKFLKGVTFTIRYTSKTKKVSLRGV
jgi:hypothetical protein